MKTYEELLESMKKSGNTEAAGRMIRARKIEQSFLGEVDGIVRRTIRDTNDLDEMQDALAGMTEALSTLFSSMTVMMNKYALRMKEDEIVELAKKSIDQQIRLGLERDRKPAEAKKPEFDPFDMFRQIFRRTAK